MSWKAIFELPEAVVSAVDLEATYPTPEERMRAAIRLARANIAQGGGPFGAAVFDASTGKLVAPGANRVVPGHASIAHAEMMAIMLGQQALQTHDFSTVGRYILTTSAEPCCQCFGALPWTGLIGLEYGATREDVENIGFDEGPKPGDWMEALRRHGLETRGPLLREEAASVLIEYAASGEPIYNPGNS